MQREVECLRGYGTVKSLGTTSLYDDVATMWFHDIITSLEKS